MNAFNLRILEADSIFYEGDCVSLIVPTQTGAYGVLAGHANEIAAIVPGEIKYKVYENDDFKVASVSVGIIKIEGPDVLILADSVEDINDIDINRARCEAEKAREMLEKKNSLRDFLLARTQLDRSMNRMRLHNKYYNEDNFDF